MSQSAAIVVAAVITGLCTLVAAFVAKGIASKGSEAAGSAVRTMVGFSVCIFTVLSLVMFFVGRVYQDYGMAETAGIFALLGFGSLLLIVFREFG